MSVELSNQILDKINMRGYDLIDHFFWRLAQLIGIAGVLVIIGIFLFRQKSKK